MTDQEPELFTYSRLLTLQAEEMPDRVAIHYLPNDGEERKISFQELDRRANQTARLFEAHGLNHGSTLVVALPNSIEHFIATFAGWKTGSTVITLRPNLPDLERDQLLELASPDLILSDWVGAGYRELSSTDLEQASGFDDADWSDRIARPGRAHASGGSTGRPKLIVSPGDGTVVRQPLSGLGAQLGFRPGQLQLLNGPLYHIMPWACAYFGLLEGHSLIVQDRFNPRSIPDIVEQYRVQFMYLAPIMMRRIILELDVREHDFSSIEAITSTAAPVPPWLKQAWIDLLGPEKVTELYGSTEGIGYAMINGFEWLEKPGSVGKPFATEIRILDEQGNDLPPGKVGEIYMRMPDAAGPSFEYVGAPNPDAVDGFQTLGDLGWLDDDGYLYIADRRTDMIITGGANVFAAEVEAAFADHPAIADITVIGVADEEWGRRVHAIIQPVDPARPPTIADLDAHVRARLANYKAPKTYEFMDQLPRNEAGKIRRTALAAERSGLNSPCAISSDSRFPVPVFPSSNSRNRK